MGGGAEFVQDGGHGDVGSGGERSTGAPRGGGPPWNDETVVEPTRLRTSVRANPIEPRVDRPPAWNEWIVRRVGERLSKPLESVV